MIIKKCKCDHKYQDKKERNKIDHFISEKFRYGGSKLSLENLRKIEQIIKLED